MARPDARRRPSRGRTSDQTNDGSFRATERDEAELDLGPEPVTPETDPENPDVPPPPVAAPALEDQPARPDRPTQPVDQPRPGLAARRAGWLGDLTRALRKDAGATANAMVNAADGFVPGAQVRSRLFLAKQRLNNARSDYNAAQAMSIDDPRRRGEVKRTERELREAEAEFATAREAAARSESGKRESWTRGETEPSPVDFAHVDAALAQDESDAATAAEAARPRTFEDGSSTVDYAPPLPAPAPAAPATQPTAPAALTRARSQGATARAQAARDLAGRTSAPMAAAGLRQWDECFVAGPDGIPTRATIVTDPSMEARAGTVYTTFSTRGPDGSVTQHSMPASAPITMRLLERGD